MFSQVWIGERQKGNASPFHCSSTVPRRGLPGDSLSDRLNSIRLVCVPTQCFVDLMSYSFTRRDRHTVHATICLSLFLDVIGPQFVSFSRHLKFATKVLGDLGAQKFIHETLVISD